MEKVNPERVVAILRKYNQTVTLEEAQLIIEFMRKLAHVEVKKILKYEDSRFIRES